MQGTYHGTDLVSTLIFVLVICAAFFVALYMDGKDAEKKGQTTAQFYHDRREHRK